MFDSESMAVRAIVVAITMQLTRVSIDLVQVAGKPAEQNDKKGSQKKKPTDNKQPDNGEKEAAADSSSEPPITSNDLEQPLLAAAAPAEADDDSLPWWLISAHISLYLQVALVLALLVASEIYRDAAFPPWLLGTTALVVALGAVASWRDLRRERYGFFQRLFYCLGTLSLCFAYECVVFNSLPLTSVDKGLIVIPHVYLALTLLDCFVANASPQRESTGGKKRLSFRDLSVLLRPYFWPDATSDTAVANRVRAILTWVCVFLNKACNLSAPLFLGWASTALAHLSYNKCIKLSIYYCIIKFFGSTMKECQSLLYLKVSQAAFVQLSEQTFEHLLSLSLDWHLRKKLGETLRNMDRGIAGCDTLMKYVFLWLLPALAECILVCIIFALYFQYAPLAITVFFFVYIYIVLTIVITLWRKQFRKAVNKSDNEWHDKSTDALINIETVKCFTAEGYEKKRFGKAVGEYQKGSVNLQASLSFLNISQQFFMQACLGASLALATIAIKDRGDCCISKGCDSLISECCLAMSYSTCPGMNVGDYVAVLTYTLNLFAPLNFLGSVYNAIVTSIIDLSNLADLLAENLDVTDAPDSLPMPTVNEDDPDIAVEFDNVIFRYPTQPADKGLKGLSFKLKRGTTTAIVGPTGAGKTTVSRLLFRFYDVGGGAVKVNGVDVRSVSQASLRGTLGIVPQTASMFNDTIKHNLLYGKRDATQEELEQVVEDAQLSNFIESLDEKYESMVGDRGLKLSGGEKQRAAIARCLLKDPPIVLLDEATSALDTLTENSVQEALDRLGSERTVLVIAHRLGTIRNADNIIVLKDGVVHEQGTHDELLGKPNGVYADMWNMQLHSTASSDNLEF